MTYLQLQKLTQLLAEKIFRNGEFMYSDLNNDVVITFDDGTQADPGVRMMYLTIF